MRKAPKPKQNGNSNAIILDWTIAGVRYFVIPPGKISDSGAVKAAEELGNRIYRDYVNGSFDSTLRRYKTPEQVRTECTPQIQFKKGFYRIYLKYNGKPLEFNAGQSQERARDFANQLEQDCINGCIDESLQKYMPQSVIADSAASKRKRLEQEYQKATQYRPSLELYREFVEFKASKLNYSSSQGYKTLLLRLESLPVHDISKASSLEEMLKTSFPYNAELTDQFLQESKVEKTGRPLSEKTRKNFSTYFTNFGKWLTEKKGYLQNPYSGLRVQLSKNLKKKAFDTDEVQRIIAYFAENIPFYANFVDFRFRVGMRSGELSALKWSDINWKDSVILVQDSFTRIGKHDSSFGFKNATKTGDPRIVPMSRTVAEILVKQKEMLDQDEKLKGHELVFPNQIGNPINPSNFAEDYWTPTLIALGIPNEGRNPYKTRHTFGSHALKQLRPQEVARIMGHDVATFFRNYEDEINKTELPDFDF